MTFDSEKKCGSKRRLFSKNSLMTALLEAGCYLRFSRVSGFRGPPTSPHLLSAAGKTNVVFASLH